MSKGDDLDVALGLPLPDGLEPEAVRGDGPEATVVVLAHEIAARLALVVAHCERNTEVLGWAGRLREIVAELDGDRGVAFDEMVLDAVITAARSVSPYIAQGSLSERAAALALLRRLQDGAFLRAEPQLARLLGARLTNGVNAPPRLRRAIRPNDASLRPGAGAFDALVSITMIRASAPRARQRRPDVDELVRQVLADPGVRLTRANSRGGRAISRKRRRTRARRE